MYVVQITPLPCIPPEQVKPYLSSASAALKINGRRVLNYLPQVLYIIGDTYY